MGRGVAGWRLLSSLTCFAHAVCREDTGGRQEAWLAVAAGSVDEERVVVMLMRWCLCIFLVYI